MKTVFKPIDHLPWDHDRVSAFAFGGSVINFFYHRTKRAKLQCKMREDLRDPVWEPPVGVQFVMGHLVKFVAICVRPKRGTYKR